MCSRSKLSVMLVFVTLTLVLIFITGCHAMKPEKPEAFFYGSQLTLAQSIAEGNPDKVKALANKTDLNKPGKQDMTLLFFALQTAYGEKPRQLEIMTQLVKAGADPVQQVPDMGGVAEVVAQAKSPLYIKALLDGGMDPNITVEDTPLIFDTASDNTLDTLKLMVARGAEIDKKDSLGKTALMDALDAMQLDCVVWLLENGADPTAIETNSGWSFGRQLEYVIQREGSDNTRTSRKLAEIKNLAISKGMQWPPVIH